MWAAALFSWVNVGDIAHGVNLLAFAKNGVSSVRKNVVDIGCKLRNYAGMTHPMKAYREAQNLPLSKLAKAVETSKGHLSRIENGIHRPSLDLIARLVHASAGKLRAEDFLPKVKDYPQLSCGKPETRQ